MSSTAVRFVTGRSPSLRPSRGFHTAPGGKPWDVVVVGGGHNGLVAAAYLAKSGRSVLVLERRHKVGGAAITEEIVSGYKFSRASYLKSLFRLDIEKDLELHRHGLQVYLRNPSSFTPMRDGRSLVLGSDSHANAEQVSQFSAKDAEALEKYEGWLERVSELLEPLMDDVPVDPLKRPPGGLFARVKQAVESGKSLAALGRRGAGMGDDLPSVMELMTAPATKILDRWFETDVVKATLATDAVIGAMVSPSSPGSGYVLLHHVMGRAIESAPRGSWGYVRGGMGAISEAIASAAREAGAHIETGVEVQEILVDSMGRACGLKLTDGSHVDASSVASNLTARTTFLSLINKSHLPGSFVKDVAAIDYTSPVFKLNVAFNKLPQFTAKALPYPADPSTAPDPGSPYHRCTIHLGSESVKEIESAFSEAKFTNRPSSRPVVEMTIPSTLDPTLAPPGHHVASLFCQYVPYNPTSTSKGDWKNGWDEPGATEKYVEKVFDLVEEYAPGFKASVVGYDALSPPGLERTFGLTGGNIFQGSMSVDQLYWLRPVPGGFSGYTTPIQGLYLCGSAAHPGGGVMGAPGRNCARVMMA
eukprot:comp22175_c0_seq1/m.32556 comp22175_c0_seq1/g.32556  ORF comp22175_c0_seq1/g.32556 comp22175_c0_seq1/m.32556 type:complete len:588 (-) comp22175_c0_seq1:636-2399(-)